MGEQSNLAVEAITPFTENSLKICKEKRHLRISMYKKSKYNSIVLPEKVDGINGYHSRCYRYFTSIKISTPKEPNEGHEGTDTARQPVKPTNKKRVKCVFCDAKMLKIRNKYRFVHKTDSVAIKKTIIDLLTFKFGSTSNKIDENDEFFYYHQHCLLKTKNNMTNKERGTRNQYANDVAHQVSYKHVKEFIRSEIIKKELVYLFSDIYQIYKEKYDELERDDQRISRKDYLLKRLKRDIALLKTTMINKSCFVYSSKVPLVSLYAKIKAVQDVTSIKTTAYQIRRKIMQMKPNVQDAPSELHTFLRYLINGPKQLKSTRSMKKIIAIGDFIINCATHGLIRTTTCVGLGLLVKSKTGCSELIRILNRLGVSINNNLVDEIETELGFHESNTTLLPMGVKSKMPELYTGVAFDNYDRYVETVDGRDTLHDTVGIVYQNMEAESDVINMPNLRLAIKISETKNRRRKYESAFNSDVPPYFKRDMPFPLMSGKSVTPINLNQILSRNDVWMMHCAFDIGTKQWNAWNAKYVIDNNPRHTIGYLPQLNVSPTHDRTIHKTLEMALEIQQHCNQRNLFLTYDLAMAKPALKIQVDTKPKFDSLFINLGPFHVQLAFFKAIGKYINESGIPKLLVLSGLISDGSLSGIVSGKHFNRCKKVHIIAALAFKTLHFKTFLQKYSNEKNECDINFNEVMDILLQERGFESVDTELKDFCDNYRLYFENTLNGIFGKTAQFIANYVYMVDIYLLHETALRTSNLELFIYASQQICGYFFTLNHQNYARYLTRNIDNLVNIDITHPGLSDQLRNGALSVRRTSKNFCRSAVDITLEQTINANAANKLTGILSLTNNISARNRWAETHATRMAIIREFYEFIGFIKRHDIGDTVHENRTFSQKVKKLIETVQDTFNPFDKDLSKEQLFHLTTGKAASEKTTEFLLNLRSDGISKMNQFISECQQNARRFEQPISRTKIVNFSTEIFKPKKTSPLTNKIHAVENEKFVIGRLLLLAIERKVNLQSILKFPLTTVPYTLAQYDGTINLCNPSKDLSSLLQNEQSSIHKDDLDIHIEIINGKDYILNLREAPNTYGKLALFILKRVCQSRAHEVHIFWEKFTDKIKIRNYKDQKEMQLFGTPAVVKITGFNQERNGLLKRAVQSGTFSNELVEFLLKTWKEHESIASILRQKRVFVSYGGECFLFSNEFDNEKMKRINRFENNHLNLELRMMLHISNTNAQNILITVDHPDNIFVILLYHMQHMEEATNIYIESSCVDKKNSKLIDVRQIFSELAPELVSALPAWFIFTGNEYEPCFFGKAKRNTLKLLTKEGRFLTAFSKLGLSMNVDPDIFPVIEHFTCRMYRSEKITVSEARAHIFECSLSENNTGKMIMIF